MLLSKRLLRRCATALLGLLVAASPVLAQLPGQDVGAQSMRPYRFVFIAYAIAWLLVFGWVLSVARRLSRLARRLEE
jgi:CcmD family protein